MRGICPASTLLPLGKRLWMAVLFNSVRLVTLSRSPETTVRLSQKLADPLGTSKPFTTAHHVPSSGFSIVISSSAFQLPEMSICSLPQLMAPLPFLS